MISVIVPTVTGREQLLQDCLASYSAHTDDYEVIVIPDRPACGEAWVDGAADAQGDYIHFSADDLQPHAGWWQAAKRLADLNLLAAPRILNTDGTLQTCGGADGFAELRSGRRTDFTRIPFLTRAQWEQIREKAEPFLREAHYYTDNCISWAAATVGVVTAVERRYLFTHHMAEQKRGAGMTWDERMRVDHERFLRHLASH